MSRFALGRVATITFDCYGTLIDWEAGAVAALRPLLARHGVALTDDAIIAAFQEIEEPLTEPPYRPYRDVLAGVVEGFGQRFGFPALPAERHLLSEALPSWAPFPDTVEALRRLRQRYRLAIVSNIDDDLFAATARRLEVDFDQVVTAQQARCYKPAVPIFALALARLGAEPGTVLHVAEGIGEVVPARQLRCGTVWVRRHGRSARLRTEDPDYEVQDLQALLPLLEAAAT